MPRISGKDAKRIANLESKLGSRTVRTLLSQESGNRLLSRQRLENLKQGTGKLTPSESERLETLSKNTRKIQNLKRNPKGLREYQVNRAIKSWTLYGKDAGTNWDSLSGDEKEQGMKAVKALGSLGVDVTTKKFYLEKGLKNSE